MYFFYFHDVYVDLPTTSALRKFLFRKIMISNCKFYRTNKRISILSLYSFRYVGTRIGAFYLLRTRTKARIRLYVGSNKESLNRNNSWLSCNKLPTLFIWYPNICESPFYSFTCICRYSAWFYCFITHNNRSIVSKNYLFNNPLIIINVISFLPYTT